jgi:hypothetical protein
MGNVIRLPYSHAGEPAYPRRANVGMADAPRDGTPIWVMVAGPADEERRKGRLPEHTRHWLPYAVVWHAGQWGYEKYRTPLFPWHRDGLMGWQENKPEILGGSDA